MARNTIGKKTRTKPHKTQKKHRDASDTQASVDMKGLWAAQKLMPSYLSIAEDRAATAAVSKRRFDSSLHGPSINHLAVTVHLRILLYLSKDLLLLLLLLLGICFKLRATHPEPLHFTLHSPREYFCSSI